MSAETEPGGQEMDDGTCGHLPVKSADEISDEITLANYTRLRYLEDEIQHAETLIREVEWGLDGLRGHLKDLNKEKATLLDNPAAEPEY